MCGVKEQLFWLVEKMASTTPRRNSSAACSGFYGRGRRSVSNPGRHPVLGDANGVASTSRHGYQQGMSLESICASADI